MGDFPTVWYRMNTDAITKVINIEVHSADFEAPVLAVFKSIDGCDNLEQVYLTNGNLACIIGTDGLAKAIGTPVSPLTNYYIAVSSHNSIGGDFEICISALSTGSTCVLSRDIQITARSNGGPLEGPFVPGETVRVCMNINEYTAAANGCQWFQGIVPVFGRGWDPSSFDLNGQPLDTRLNNTIIGQANNGLYGTATWDWFTNVGYHHDHPSLNIGDHDGDGRIELCNSVYETDCPFTGITGGCCGACWADQGDILPPGWFAYGINGTCPTPGPPIAVDWGDGNTCGGGMGPWSFCFDLITRGTADCQSDSAHKDLSLGFFTFADGEVGAWTGGPSVCALDQPVKLSLNATCGRVVSGIVEELPSLCSGDTLYYQIEAPGISYWEWNISPFSAAPYLMNQGENGFSLAVPLINTTGSPVSITGIFLGYEPASEDLLIKKIHFTLDDPNTCPLVDVDDPRKVHSAAANHLRIYPTPSRDQVTLEWTLEIDRVAYVDIFNVEGIRLKRLPVPSGQRREMHFEINDLLPGVYFIRLYDDDTQLVTKLVKL